MRCQTGAINTNVPSNGILGVVWTQHQSLHSDGTGMLMLGLHDTGSEWNNYPAVQVQCPCED